MLRSKKELENFLSIAPKLPQYEVESHGTLTENMRAFVVPKDTAIVHFNIPGLSTVAKVQSNNLGTHFSNENRRRLLAGNGRWRKNTYSVIYIEGDTIPDVELNFQCMVSKTGIYNYTAKKTIMSRNQSIDENNACVKTLSSVVTEQGPGVYFVVACRPMHPRAKGTKLLLDYQKRNLQARARYNQRNIEYYEKFIGSSSNAGDILSRMLSGYLPANAQMIRIVRSQQLFLGIVHKISRAIAFAQVTYPTYRACEFFNLQFLGVPVILFALLIAHLLHMSHGHIPVYMSARGMMKTRALVKKLHGKVKGSSNGTARTRANK